MLNHNSGLSNACLLVHVALNTDTGQLGQEVWPHAEMRSEDLSTMSKVCPLGVALLLKT